MHNVVSEKKISDTIMIALTSILKSQPYINTPTIVSKQLTYSYFNYEINFYE